MADILALAKLIEQTTPSQQQEELLSRSSTTTPASLVPSATPQLSNATSPRAQASRVEEVHEEPDDRKIPEYTITYKQKVGVEDVYLGWQKKVYLIGVTHLKVLAVELILSWTAMKLL